MGGLRPCAVADMDRRGGVGQGRPELLLSTGMAERRAVYGEPGGLQTVYRRGVLDS